MFLKSVRKWLMEHDLTLKPAKVPDNLLDPLDSADVSGNLLDGDDEFDDLFSDEDELDSDSDDDFWLDDLLNDEEEDESDLDDEEDEDWSGYADKWLDEIVDDGDELDLDSNDDDDDGADVDLSDRVNGKPVRAYPYSIPRHNWTPGRRRRPGGDITPHSNPHSSPCKPFRNISKPFTNPFKPCLMVQSPVCLGAAFNGANWQATSGTGARSRMQ